MADQIPDSAKTDAIDILTTYVDFIRNEVRADDFERHPYVPHIEQTIEGLRAAPPAMDREASMVGFVQTIADMVGDELEANCSVELRDQARAILSTLSADAIRQREGENGYTADDAVDFVFNRLATPASHASDGGEA